jgi:hypothetical protein
MRITCLFCNHQNSADARFCNECGTPTETRPCKRCNAVDKRTATHCHQCGAPFATPAEADGASRLASTLTAYDAGAMEPPLFRTWNATPLRERGPGGFDENPTSSRALPMAGHGDEAPMAGTSHQAHPDDDLLPGRAIVSTTLADGVLPTRYPEADRTLGGGWPAPATGPGASRVAGRERQPSWRRLRSIAFAVALLTAGAITVTALIDRDERPDGAGSEVHPTSPQARRSGGPVPSTNVTAGEIAGPRDAPASHPAAGPPPSQVGEAQVPPHSGTEGANVAPSAAWGASAGTSDPDASASATAAAPAGATERQPPAVATRPSPGTAPSAASPVPPPRKPFIPPNCTPALAAMGLCSADAPAVEK